MSEKLITSRAVAVRCCRIRGVICLGCDSARRGFGRWCCREVDRRVTWRASGRQCPYRMLPARGLLGE